LEDVPVSGLTAEEALMLLGVEPKDWEPRQIEKLSRWIESIVRNRGENFVRDNRAELLRQWEHYVKAEFKTCI
jgi:hypothetical protein